MKNLSLLFIALLLTVNIYSQCTENAFGFGNNSSTPSYNISGDVSVTLNTNNTITIDFSNNFSTASGPDVRVYLVNSDGKSDATLKNTLIADLDNIHFGEITSSGAQSYTIDIPENSDISNYDKVFFYCLQFNAFWDVGSFNAFTNQSCTALNTTENEFTKISIYTNPTSSIIELNNIDVLHAEIHIFDVHGKSVFTQVNQNNSVIDVSTFTAGTYFLHIYQNQKVLSKKLMVQ